MRTAVMLVLALALVLFGAEMLTNAVEWLGKRLNLGEGAVGSVFAALGTALPETTVPVTAILLGRGSAQAHDVGIGGILGAPFLLATLGSLVMAIALLITRRSHPSPEMAVQHRAFNRDMTFFLVAYAFSLVVGCLNVSWLHQFAPAVLLGMYLLFLFTTLRDKSMGHETSSLQPLYMQFGHGDPGLPRIGLQLVVALISIVGGAQLLTVGVSSIAAWFKLPAFVISALLIPLTTELPETLNSVVWIRQGKDSLALGNITGAMVFQSTLVPALGIALTPWQLNHEALLTGGLTLAAAGLIYGYFRMYRALIPSILVAASLLYWILPLQTIAVRYDMKDLYWLGGALVAAALLLSVRWGVRMRSA